MASPVVTPKKPSLQRRILLLVIVGMLLMFSILGISSFLSVRETIDRALKERLILAQTAADHLDYVLRQNLVRLQDLAFTPGVNLLDKNLEPEKIALHNAYLYSIFTDGVFLLDAEGKILWTEPLHQERLGINLSSLGAVKGALSSGKPLISDIISLEPTGKRVILAAVPIKDSRGQVIGVAGGEIDPTRASLREVIQSVQLGKTGYIEVVDSNGYVLATTRPYSLFAQSDHGSFLADRIRGKQTVVGTCHRCHGERKMERRETEVMAFAPLASIPWGVSIRQSEAEALAPARSMERRFFAFSFLLLLIAVVLAWGTARSVIRPIGLLRRAAQKIAAGNLSDHIPLLGEDEIGRLASTFDDMRQKLKNSLDSVEDANRELEFRVQQRTKELLSLYEELQKKEIIRGELLRKAISAQEEERKRIARELHDDSSQALAALVLALERALSEAANEDAREKIRKMRSLAVETLDGVHQLIYDLRPALLDDLGLASAVRWFAESHLEPLGFKVNFQLSGQERRLSSEMETALFRVVQEAITNVAKHSEGENVTVELRFLPDTVRISVTDDGQGFDVKELAQSPDRARGLGLLGMKERVILLEGTLNITSQPGKGTRVFLEVPSFAEETPHE